MVEKYQISHQIDFVKDLTKRLPNHESELVVTDMLITLKVA